MTQMVSRETQIMRRELDRWCFHKPGESPKEALSRFLIAMDELRARLAPGRYPNLEISDEGYLWFNLDTPLGPAEILACPFGLEEDDPVLIFSLPRRAAEVSQRFMEGLNRLVARISGARLIAGVSGEAETLSAYRDNRHPPFVVSVGIEAISSAKDQSVFFCVLGIEIPVREALVGEIEKLVKKILPALEGLL